MRAETVELINYLRNKGYKVSFREDHRSIARLLRRNSKRLHILTGEYKKKSDQIRILDPRDINPDQWVKVRDVLSYLADNEVISISN